MAGPILSINKFDEEIFIVIFMKICLYISLFVRTKMLLENTNMWVILSPTRPPQRITHKVIETSKEMVMMKQRVGS